MLILDNMTTIESVQFFQEAASEISDVIESSPFREIWLYTGYYSDLDGNNSEFTFIPLKLSSEMLQVFSSEK